MFSGIVHTFRKSDIAHIANLDRLNRTHTGALGRAAAQVDRVPAAGMQPLNRSCFVLRFRKLGSGRDLEVPDAVFNGKAGAPIFLSENPMRLHAIARRRNGFSHPVIIAWCAGFPPRRSGGGLWRALLIPREFPMLA